MDGMGSMVRLHKMSGESSSISIANVLLNAVTQAGKEIRRRFCDHPGFADIPTSADPSCYCAGKDSEERDCIFERVRMLVSP